MFLNEKHQRKAELIYGNNIWKNLGVPGFIDGGRVGFEDVPQVVNPSIPSGVSSGQTIQVEVEISDEQLDRLADRIAERASEGVESGLMKANEENRRIENLNNRTR